MNLWKILNILSLLGVLILFVLHFQQTPLESLPQSAAPIEASSNAIVFVNSDTLRAHYSLVKEMTESLEADYSIRERDIKGRQDRYEKDAAYFQQQVQAGSLTEQSAQMIYEDLMRNQQELMELRDRYTDEIAEKEYRMNERFVDSVYSFLERYNRQYGYDYILGYSRGSGILNAKDTLDITRDVLLLMNAEYESKKPQ
jgi:outer membrane protein